MSSFSELPLSAPIARAIAELGYETPSPVQAETLPILLGEATDFIGLAATGTGKTAAFAIPLLEKLDPSKRSVQALILCPTRELAIQVAGQIDLLGKYKRVHALPIYGGASYTEQFRGLDRGVAVVVGTPGRIVDHLKRGSLKLDELQTIILDEADEMISMGFEEDMSAILAAAPEETCSKWLFSATMSRDVRRVAEEFLRSPKQVQINRKEMLPSTVEQLYFMTREGNKPDILCKLIDAADDFYGIIFCQTKALVMDLTQYLVDRGYKVDCLHGDKNQAQRERTMQSFRDRRVNVMVCTDVAARGLDVKDVTHVINFSIPRELDNYVHRIGRTGRSGKNGVAMSLVTPSHRHLIFQIEKMTKSRMVEGKLPTRKDIGMKKVSKQLTRFQEQAHFDRAIGLMDDSWKSAIAEMSGEEIAARFLALAFPEIFAEQMMPQMAKPNSTREPRSFDGPPPKRRAQRNDSGRSGDNRGDQRSYQRRDSNRGDYEQRGGYRDADGPQVFRTDFEDRGDSYSRDSRRADARSDYRGPSGYKGGSDYRGPRQARGGANAHSDTYPRYGNPRQRRQDGDGGMRSPKRSARR